MVIEAFLLMKRVWLQLTKSAYRVFFHWKAVLSSCTSLTPDSQPLLAICMATCSCRCWFRACDSLRACLVLDDSTSTVLMTYCERGQMGRHTEVCECLALTPGP